MKAVWQQTTLKLLIACAYICYLLLLLLHCDQRIMSASLKTTNTWIKLKYEILWWALFTVVTSTIIFILLPIDIMEFVVPASQLPYIPKRLRYRTKWRNRWKRWIAMTLVAVSVIKDGIAHPTIDAKSKQMDHTTMTHTYPENRDCNKYIVALPSIQHTMTHPTRRQSKFDHESFTIVIDNACSYCITNDLKHYVLPPEDISVPVKGIGGIQIKATKKGTVRWSFANDQGQVHDELIPNTYYHQDSPYCLYSPQHVAQIANDHTPNKNGTMCVTYADTMQLIWDQRSQQRTIRLDPQTNIFMMQSDKIRIRIDSFLAQ